MQELIEWKSSLISSSCNDPVIVKQEMSKIQSYHKEMQEAFQAYTYLVWPEDVESTFDMEETTKLVHELWTA